MIGVGKDPACLEPPRRQEKGKEHHLPCYSYFFQNKGGDFSGCKEIYGKAPIYQILALPKIEQI